MMRPSQWAWDRFVSEMIMEMDEEELEAMCRADGTTIAEEARRADVVIERALRSVGFPVFRPR